MLHRLLLLVATLGAHALMASHASVKRLKPALPAGASAQVYGAPAAAPASAQETLALCTEEGAAPRGMTTIAAKLMAAGCMPR